jgi:hypothetical protein
MILQTADLLDFVTLLLVETRLENKFHTSLNNCRDLHKIPQKETHKIFHENYILFHILTMLIIHNHINLN